MKNNEVMLGDWVFYTGATFGQNVDKPCYRRIRSCDFSVDEENQTSIERYFKPIPLTTELLEANGFEYVCSSIVTKGLMRLKIDKGTTFWISVSTNPKAHPNFWIKCGTQIIEIGYVHLLQQVLRLHGFSEKADNFKVDVKILHTEDLALYDWVHVTKCDDGVLFREDDYQISSLFANTEKVCLFSDPIVSAESFFVKPVKLTEDILRLNGWVDKGSQEYRHECALCVNSGVENGFDVFNFYEDSSKYKVQCVVKYVHELQHILRAVGQREMANRFKIKE